MNAMRSFTLRTLAENRVRTIVTIAGVALAAALLTAVSASVSSLNEFLLKNEIASSGTWTARTWVDDDRAIEAAREDATIQEVLVTRDVGTHLFDETESMRYGKHLTVVSMEGDSSAMTGFKVCEGRIPGNAGEIALPKSFIGSNALGGERIELGAQITLDLGIRTAQLKPGADPADDPYLRTHRDDVPDYQIYSGGVNPRAISDGDVLNSRDPYRNADDEGAVFGETLANASPRSYTVVGFYEGRNQLTWTNGGFLALCGPDPQAAGPACLYVRTSGFDSMASLEAHLKNTLGNTFLDYHTSLLRYAGVSDGRAVWTTLYRFAAILAAVIVIACVSLIYNAFAISIAERTKQFGLLSSIGASRSQIRRAVIFEAMVIAAIGAPLGIAVGLGGTALVLGMLAPAIQKIASTDASVPFSLAVEPASLAVVALLTLITVLASVWIPARRACSVSAIDAIRSSNDLRDVKPARKPKRNSGEPWKKRGVGFHRLFGIAGQLAHANRRHGRGKGGAASASLCLAVVLLITAGSATTYLTLGTRYLGTNDYDISTSLVSSFGLDETQCADAYEKMLAVDGVEGLGWSMRADFITLTPVAMAGSGFSEESADPRGMSTVKDGDAWQSHISFVFVDDESFSKWARSEGIDPTPYLEGNAKAGIGIKGLFGNNGSAYQYSETFATTGTIRALIHASWEGGEFEGVLHGEKAEPSAVFAMPDGTTVYKSIADVSDQMTAIEVNDLAEQGPTCALSASYAPTVVLPARAIGDLGVAGTLTECISVFNADDHAAAAAKIAEIGEDIRTSHSTSEGSAHFDVYDVKEDEESSQMLITIIEIFSLLFTGILMLIAMANVFNTVTNGLILRKREFAVMRSIGLGTGDFRKMIACECLGFGVRGLVPGVIVSIVVAYLLYLALGGTVEGLPFTLPWRHIALAVALVSAITLISVAYGLRRCRTDSVVEALRMDAA